LRIAYVEESVGARWPVGDCAKSKKLKKKRKPEQPQFECDKCGLEAAEKKLVCKPAKIKKKNKKSKK